MTDLDQPWRVVDFGDSPPDADPSRCSRCGRIRNVVWIGMESGMPVLYCHACRPDRGKKRSEGDG